MVTNHKEKQMIDSNWARSVIKKAQKLISKGDYKEASLLYLQIEYGAEAQALATLHLANIIGKNK